jgi:hypothetical protein
MSGVLLLIAPLALLQIQETPIVEMYHHPLTVYEVHGLLSFRFEMHRTFVLDAAAAKGWQDRRHSLAGTDAGSRLEEVNAGCPFQRCERMPWMGKVMTVRSIWRQGVVG